MTRVATDDPLELLYEQDETAWLDAMAKLAAAGRSSEMDFRNLAEYLESMAKRDRREVYNRLVVLLAHLAKWEFQSGRRTRSWTATLEEQRRRLRQLLESATLRRYAESVLAKAYADARRKAANETGLILESFPAEWTSGLAGALGEQA